MASLIPPELNAQITLVDEGIEEVDLDAEADLVGISAGASTKCMTFSKQKMSATGIAAFSPSARIAMAGPM